MRHPLNWIVRAGFSPEDRSALLGDLEEEYRRRVRPARGWLAAQAWYSVQLIKAAVRGSVTTRDSRGAPPWPRLFRGGGDSRHGLRRWRHRPGFALTAILTLALGIGATTATFSLVDAVLLQPLPWTDPDRLVAVHAVYPQRRQNPAAALTWNRGTVSYQTWDALRQEAAFADVGVWRRRTLDTTFGEARTALVETMDVSSGFLPMLGVRLAHGRFFTTREDDDNSNSVILTYEAWQRHFGGRADVIGQAARLGHASSGDDEAKIIVGVLEPGFSFDGDLVPEVLFPVGIGAAVQRQYLNGGLRVVARLRPEVEVTAAAVAADRIIRLIETREPSSGRVVPLPDDLTRGATRPLLLLFGGAALLLLIACSNVAGLLLGDGRARRHEFAVRAALGGGRARMVRQLLVEHALLGVAGAAAGLSLAYWLMKMCVAFAPAALPRLADVALDGRVVLFALALGMLTLLVFGVVPAWSLARTPAARALAEGGRDGASSRHSGQRIVVAAALALALVLLVGASLFGETLLRLAALPLGFDPSNLTVVSFRMTTLPNQSEGRITAEEYRALTPEQHRVRNRQLADRWTTGWFLHTAGAMDRLAALPGVTGVAGGYSAPFLGVRPAILLRLPERPKEDGVLTRGHTVTEGYFETMKTPILRGRNFEPRDRIGADRAPFSRDPNLPPPPASTLISQELERRIFGGSGVGRQLVLGDRLVLNVIGVVPNARWRKGDDDLAAYYVLGEAYNTVSTFFIRTSGDTAVPLSAIRSTLQAYNPNIVVTSTASMDQLMSRAVAEERFRALLSVLFGGVALLLAVVGLYGLVARRVADRRREIGVRVALGARPADVRALVFMDAIRTIAIGFAVGLPMAFAASQVTQTLLYGVSPTAPHVFAAAGAALAIAAIAAALVPARRATSIDPILVLKD